MIEKEDVNRITLNSPPPMVVEFKTPVPGDTCTAAVIVNAIFELPNLAPGYHSMADLASIKTKQALLS